MNCPFNRHPASRPHTKRQLNWFNFKPIYFTQNFAKEQDSSTKLFFKHFLPSPCISFLTSLLIKCIIVSVAYTFRYAMSATMYYEKSTNDSCFPYFVFVSLDYINQPPWNHEINIALSFLNLDYAKNLIDEKPWQRLFFRYKMLSEKTWPNWKDGAEEDGVKHILDVSKKQHLNE